MLKVISMDLGGNRRSHRPPRAFYFFDYCYFHRDTQREPVRRREHKGKRDHALRTCAEGGAMSGLAVKRVD